MGVIVTFTNNQLGEIRLPEEHMSFSANSPGRIAWREIKMRKRYSQFVIGCLLAGAAVLTSLPTPSARADLAVADKNVYAVFTTSHVPEPTSLALLAFGIGTVLLRGKRPIAVTT